MCWKPTPGKEVFQSEMASDIAVQLCFKIAEEIESRKCPDCGSPKRNLTTPKHDPCKPNKDVKVPEYDYLTEGYDPNKLPKKKGKK